MDGSAPTSPEPVLAGALVMLVQALETVLERLAVQEAQLEHLQLSATALAIAVQRLEGRVAMSQDGLDDLTSALSREAERTQRVEGDVAQLVRHAAQPQTPDPAFVEELVSLRSTLRDSLLLLDWLVEQDQLR